MGQLHLIKTNNYHKILVNTVQDYVNRTLSSYKIGDDDFVSKTFGNFKDSLGGLLPPYFIHRLFALLTCTLVPLMTQILYRQGDTLHTFLASIKTKSMEAVRKEKKPFLEVIRYDLNLCTKTQP